MPWVDFWLCRKGIHLILRIIMIQASSAKSFQLSCIRPKSLYCLVIRRVANSLQPEGELWLFNSTTYLWSSFKESLSTAATRICRTQICSLYTILSDYIYIESGIFVNGYVLFFSTFYYAEKDLRLYIRPAFDLSYSQLHDDSTYEKSLLLEKSCTISDANSSARFSLLQCLLTISWLK